MCVSNHDFLFLFPAPPIPEQHSAVKGVAKFDFTAESEDELTLKVTLSVTCEDVRFRSDVRFNGPSPLCVLLQVGDIITQVESVDEQWIVGVVGGKRGVVPKNYISLL